LRVNFSTTIDMITDPLFYRLFETIFLLLGMTTESAREMAARYRYQAIEFKEISHRSDGVFLPKEPGEMLYFVEVQFYRLHSVYVDLLAKVYTYLKHHDPGQPFRGVVLFASRVLEPAAIEPCEPLLESGYIQRFYLDEMEELDNAPLSLSILYLISQSETLAPSKARELITRVKAEIDDEALRRDLVQLIETVILYKLSHLSREEVQTMLQAQDIRETRLFKEIKEEGFKEGKEEGLKEGIRVMAMAMKMSAEEIAAALKLDEQLVRKLMPEIDQN
jgi:predicted transposase/invertase (TIGR01784 family)